MTWIAGGSFAMGSEDFYPEERPIREVTVEGFWIDTAPVTVAQFRRFVRATGWVTVAERDLDPAPGSLVFHPTPDRCRSTTSGVVVLRRRRLLAPAGRARERHLHAWAPSGRPRHARGRRGVRGVGGRGAADRGRVGVRGQRRDVRAGQPLVRGLPVARLSRDVAGGHVPAQRPRPDRHGRQRVGVDHRRRTTRGHGGCCGPAMRPARRRGA